MIFGVFTENAKRQIPTVPILGGATEHSPSPPPSSPHVAKSASLDNAANNNHLRSNASLSSNEDIIVPHVSNLANAVPSGELERDIDEDGWNSEDFDDDSISVAQEPFLSESALQVRRHSIWITYLEQYCFNMWKRFEGFYQLFNMLYNHDIKMHNIASDV